VFVKEADCVIILGSYDELKEKGVNFSDYLQQAEEPEINLFEEVPKIIRLRSRLTLFENEDMRNTESDIEDDILDLSNGEVTY